jgi:hypothetical protein
MSSTKPHPWRDLNTDEPPQGTTFVVPYNDGSGAEIYYRDPEGIYYNAEGVKTKRPGDDRHGDGTWWAVVPSGITVWGLKPENLDWSV